MGGVHNHVALEVVSRLYGVTARLALMAVEWPPYMVSRLRTASTGALNGCVLSQGFR